MRFFDRVHAGRLLAGELKTNRGARSTIVLGLPRGGVVLAHEIAQALHLPLDIVVVRKIGAPDNPEFAIGAITADGMAVIDEVAIAELHVSQKILAKLITKESREARRREMEYRLGKPPLNLKDLNVILVDDGIATGQTMKLAIKWVQFHGAKKIIVAIPVASPEVLDEISNQSAVEIVCLNSPKILGSIGSFYYEFPQNTDEEIIAIMKLYETKK